MITPEDKELLAQKGISEVQIAEQLTCFQKGFPYLKLDAAASVEKGILAPDAEEQKAYLAAWDAYTNSDKTIVKFVPLRVLPAVCSKIFLNFWMLTMLSRLQSSNKRSLPQLRNLLSMMI